MPNLTIYVPDELAAEVKLYGLPVSKVCQVALRRKVRAAERAAYDSTYRSRLQASLAGRGQRTPDTAA